MTRPKLIIIGIFCLALTIRLICFVGLIGSDDLTYNRNAYEIALGTFTPQAGHQYTRLGIFFPVAIVFTFFGVNEISSILFPFFCFIVIFWLLMYFTTKYWGTWTGIIAGLLYAFLPIEIFHATMLLTDLPSATCIALSGIIVYRCTRPERFNTVELRKIPPNPPLKKGEIDHVPPLSKGGLGGILTSPSLCMFLGGLLLGWAYLIRETAVFFVVFIVGSMLYHVWKWKTLRWGWIWFGFGVLCVVGFEAGYYYWTTGNPFYRYFSVQSGHNISLFSGRRFQGFSLLRRLTLDPFQSLFHVQDFGFYYFFVCAGIIYGVRQRSEPLRYVIGWFLTLFLLLNFGSTSLSAYLPLLLFNRFFVILSFPAIIIMSWYLYEMRHFFVLNARRNIIAMRLSLLIPSLLMLVVNILWFSVARTLLLLSMLLLLVLTSSEGLRSWCHARLSPKYAVILLPALLLYLNILPGTYMAAKGERPRKGLVCERDIRPLLEFPLTHTIYTDIRTESILEYFYQYQHDDQIRNFEHTEFEQLNNAYIIVNWDRLLFLNRLYDNPIPADVYRPPSSWKPYAQIEGKGKACLIYEIVAF